jgi:hypothetical protein
MERAYCPHCEQTYVTTNLERCVLCGNSGPLTPADELPSVTGARGTEKGAASRRRFRTVTLRRADGLVGKLPRLCMRCGGPADCVVPKTFLWHPRWIFLLLLHILHVIPFIIVMLATSRQAQLYAPMCNRHKRHWFLRGVTIWLTFIGAVVSIAVAWVIVGDPKPYTPNPRGVLWVAAAFFMFGWVILVVVLQMTGIRATEITTEAIRLTNVSSIFGQSCQSRTEESAGHA